MIRSLFSRPTLAARWRNNSKSRSRGMRKGSWGSEWLRRNDGGLEWYQWGEREIKLGYVLKAVSTAYCLQKETRERENQR